jgi:hypothetical protein
MNLARNAIRTPDGTILESHYRHDFVCYKDKNGRNYHVDGGLEYTKRGFENVRDYEELSVSANAPFEEIRAAFSWGTYGKSGKDPLKWILLKDMEASHIQAILDSKQVLGHKVEEWFKAELKLRLNE